MTDVVDLDSLARKALRLVPVPSSAVRLARVVGDPDASLDELVQIVSFDQVLTLKLLRAANSAASASALRIASVEEAVSRLGGARIAAMAMAFAVAGPMKQRLPQYDLEEGDLWRHAVASAVAVELIPTIASVAIPPESFTAALLHDCGKLIICQFAPPDSLVALLQAREEGLCPVAAELRTFGFDHGEVGAAIAKKWNLPGSIVRGISSHHHCDKACEPVCDVVSVASAAAKQLQATQKGAEPSEALPLSCLERLGLGAGEFETLCERMPGRFQEISKSFEG